MNRDRVVDRAGVRDEADVPHPAQPATAHIDNQPRKQRLRHGAQPRARPRADLYTPITRPIRTNGAPHGTFDLNATSACASAANATRPASRRQR